MIYNEKYECMPRSELENLQSERLVGLVKRVYENVPIYRAKMDEIKLKPTDIRSIKDLTKLPFTVKHDLRESYPYGMFAVDREKIVRMHASSGTTGKLTVSGYTENDIGVWSEIVARALCMAGATKKSTVHICYGYGLFTGGLGLHYGVEKLGASAVPASAGNTKRQLMLLKDFGADIIACTPSYAVYLAGEIKKEGYTLADFNLKSGIFGAEPWSEEMRKVIEKELQISAYDIYGLSEVMGPGVASECSFKCGSHIQEDHFIPEIIDPDTLEPVKEGERGELVFTTITKEGMPLIRYRTRDLTSLDYSPCECGRTTARMARVIGRSDDMLIIRGVNVFPSQIESAIMKVSGVEPHYMIIVSREGMLDTLEVQIEMNDALVADTISKIERTRKQIETEVNSMIGVSANIKLVEPNTLPRSEGKAKRIIDNRKY